jgi:hypothetical protein
MTHLLLFLDVAPTGGTIGAIFAVGFFLLLAGAAFIAYKSLRKTVKWAFRIAIVVGILVIALVGSITLWWYSSSGGTPKQRPPASRPRQPA